MSDVPDLAELRRLCESRPVIPSASVVPLLAELERLRDGAWQAANVNLPGLVAERDALKERVAGLLKMNDETCKDRDSLLKEIERLNKVHGECFKIRAERDALRTALESQAVATAKGRELVGPWIAERDALRADLEVMKGFRDECERQYQEKVAEVGRLVGELNALRGERAGEAPLAWIVTWDGHELYADGESVDYFVCSSEEEAKEVADRNCTVEDGDLLPQIVPLYRRPADSDAGMRAAAQALVERLEAVHNDFRYHAVWASYQVHGGNYEGPKYDKEIAALKEALAAAATKGEAT